MKTIQIGLYGSKKPLVFRVISLGPFYWYVLPYA